MDAYWKDLVSTALRVFQESKNIDAVTVIKSGILSVEFNSHDNWDGGVDFWDIVFQLKYRVFKTLGDRKNTIESDLLTVLSQFHTDGSNQIANVIVRPIIERFVDWQAALPATKETTIQQIHKERELLTAIATGTSYKNEGIEEAFQKRHKFICTVAAKAGFEYPITCESLAEWWIQIRDVGGYSERRAYISQLFAPLMKLLTESDDSSSIDFNHIASRSGIIQKAVDDAMVFIRDGRYDSAVDRVHTAFHGYLRQLLTDHQIVYGREDSLSALYNKLHDYYEKSIQPPDVAVRVKTIMRSGIGIINTVNELRNNNTIAHPNGLLIQVREAQLVIRLVNAIVDYIEDVEKSLH